MKTKNIFSPKGLIVALLLSTVAFGGCKKFLDVNENPNNPETATPTLLLPTVEASIGQLMGNGLQIYGNIWAQYWTQRPGASQYRTFDQYNVTNTTFDRTWLTIYRNALQNAQLIIDSKTSNSDQFKGIAYLLKAYTFQVATDAFGDIPLTEALNAANFASPKYDTQATVYDSIFTYVDKGLALVKSTGTSPGTQDMVFGGVMANWEAFGNTLKLKAYMRLSNVDAAKARAGIAALYATNPTFLTADAQITYTTTGGNQNPLFNEMVALSRTQNLGASRTAVTAFATNNDPRAFAYYSLASTSTDTIAYIVQGSSNQSINSRKIVSTPSPLVGGDVLNDNSATAPVKFMSAAESAFLQAEAVARGYVSGNVLALFNQGITASFTAANIPASAAAYIASAPDAVLPASADGQIKAIITQKYYAMCGAQGFEAWTEYRRTGYPDFIITSVSSVIGGENKPLRFLYPNSEVTTNTNFPGTIPLTTPVWWDK
jgi:hypothetical protein